MSQTVMIAGCGDVGGRLGEALLADGWRVHGLRRSVDALPQGSCRWLAICRLRSVPRSGRASRSTTWCTAPPPVSTTRLATVPPTSTACAMCWAGCRPTASGPGACCSSPAPGLRADRWRLDRRGVAGAFPGLFRTDHARRRAGRAGQRDTGYPRAPGRHLRSGAGVAAQPGAPGVPGGQRAALYANRIHADDAAGLLAFLLRADAGGQALEDCYIGVDDAPVAMHEVVDYLRQRLGVSQWADEHSVRRAGSKRCSNRRARALGWVPRYPSYREGYAAVLGDA